jgi:hypothetical protein
MIEPKQEILFGMVVYQLPVANLLCCWDSKEIAENIYWNDITIQWK